MINTHNDLHSEWMKKSEYWAAYEEELQKEKFQALLTEWCTSVCLTKKLGVNHSTISRMESNFDNASIRNIIKYAAACGIQNPIISF